MQNFVAKSKCNNDFNGLSLAFLYINIFIFGAKEEKTKYRGV